MLDVKNLNVSTEDGLEILKDINLKINNGEIVILMGPNGSGKSTLGNIIMGNPNYVIKSGEIIFDGEKINDKKPDERARKGIFLSFQYPAEISGVTISNFLRTALNSIKGKKVDVIKFKEILKEKMELLSIDSKFSERYLNEGFSGGEKKKTEILQLSIFEPRFAILDETDSGTDVDALKIIANSINIIKEKNNMTCLIITHYNRILKYIKPDKVIIMIKGRIAKEGGRDLADEIEEQGYEKYLR